MLHNRIKTTIAALLVGIMLLSSCTKEAEVMETAVVTETAALRAAMSDYDAAAKLPVKTISGEIKANTTWYKNYVYELSGIVAVTNGATLTIEPGTMIKAKPLAGQASGVLVICKGAKIKAVGTPTQPIVFTSYNLLDKNPATTPETGDFGGIVLLGAAPVNTPSDKRVIEGVNSDDIRFSYGGSYAEDNSGIMQYVRIEYAGYELEKDNEINGLTCGGVGSGTTLDHIQVSWGKDDSFEFFGGTVNASYLISYAADDDNFDFDNGYRGTIKYALSLANSTSTHSASKGKTDSNGIELDNNATDQDENYSLTPKTHPTLNYVTIVGTKTRVQAPFKQKDESTIISDAYKYGARIRRGGEITMMNSIITGYPMGLVIDKDADKSKSSFINCAFHGFDAPFSPTPMVAGITGAASKPGAAAITFGMKDPFYDTMNFNTAANGRGAFANNSTWHLGWTLFN